jgi:hypothetical protein
MISLKMLSESQTMTLNGRMILNNEQAGMSKEAYPVKIEGWESRCPGQDLN